MIDFKPIDFKPIDFKPDDTGHELDDIVALVKFLKQLGEHFGIPLNCEDADFIVKVRELARHLREYQDLGQPRDIIAAIAQFYELRAGLKMFKFKRSYCFDMTTLEYFN